MPQSRDIFQAIADPTRRQIITMLAAEPMNVNAIASRFDTTRQAVSLHVQLLSDCGLITIRQQGRERYCEASLDRLSVVSDWVEESKKVWMHRFKALENFLDKAHNKQHHKIKRTKHATRKHRKTR